MQTEYLLDLLKRINHWRLGTALQTRVPVFIKVRDVNDNAPEFAMFYETFVCENVRAGQVCCFFIFIHCFTKIFYWTPLPVLFLPLFYKAVALHL